LNRRQFLTTTSMALAAAGQSLLPGANAPAAARQMTLCLAPGSIGVQANQVETIRLAHQFGFESVEANGGYLAGLTDAQLGDLLADMKTKNLVFGAAGLPVDFRGDDTRFQESLKSFPKFAAGLQRAGVNRVGTWLTPASDQLTYVQNFKRHAARLREAAMILKDHGARLGLEYVGPLTSRVNRRFWFAHTLTETRELIAEIGTGNVGVVLDSWHWYTAKETEADLLSLTANEVVSVDLNDAPVGLPVEQQQDGRRELPAATGVIDLKLFLNALVKIGYDGPVRAEPFNKALNDLDNDAACAATIAAMKKAFALIG
jgi:sugar phosphate isomerase/epimerase